MNFTKIWKREDLYIGQTFKILGTIYCKIIGFSDEVLVEHTSPFLNALVQYTYTFKQVLSWVNSEEIKKNTPHNGLSFKSPPLTVPIPGVKYNESPGREAMYEPVKPLDGRKNDSGKQRYDLLPPKALDELVKVLTFGSKKYNDDNWRDVPEWNKRYFAAAQRHQWQYKRGERIDSGEGGSDAHHLAAAIASLMFLLEKELENNSKCNRGDFE